MPSASASNAARGAQRQAKRGGGSGIGFKSNRIDHWPAAEHKVGLASIPVRENGLIAERHNARLYLCWQNGIIDSLWSRNPSGEDVSADFPEE